MAVSQESALDLPTGGQDLTPPAALETLPREPLERLLRLTAKTLAVPMAALSFFFGGREWFHTCRGLRLRQVVQAGGFGAAVIAAGDIVVVRDALADPRFRHHPLVAGGPRLRFYAGRPVVGQRGGLIGVLAVMADRPGELPGEDICTLDDLALLVERELERDEGWLADLRRLNAAASALEDGRFTPAQLLGLEARADEVGRLARRFMTMAEAVQARELRLKQANLETIQRLVIAAEYKDRATGGHIRRMSEISGLLARHLGLSEEEVALVRTASPMHDVGKLGVPDAILLKPGGLSPSEWNIVRRHTVIGAGILAGSDSPLLQAGEIVALSHHEWWNGEGYPNGMSGEDIPLLGRLCAVADVFDALTSERPYKPAYPADEAVATMLAGREQQFDPAILDLFEAHLDEILAL